MKIGIRVIYESFSPVMLRTPKNAFDFIPPALGSSCHLLDAQQIFVGWTDGWMYAQTDEPSGNLPIVLSSICLLLKYPANPFILDIR